MESTHTVFMHFWVSLFYVLTFIRRCDSAAPCPRPETLAEFRRGICSPTTVKACLCSPNSKRVLQITDENSEQLTCGGRIDKTAMAAGKFQQFTFKFQLAASGGAYAMVLVDPEGSPGDGNSWLHWVKERVDADDLDGSPTGSLSDTTDTIPYSAPTPPPRTGVHRYQLYVFEYDVTQPFSSSIQQHQAMRGGFQLKTFMQQNSLCTKFVAGFQFNIAHNFASDDCSSDMTCDMPCGVSLLCVWPSFISNFQQPCGGYSSNLQELDYDSRIKFYGAIPGNKYMLIVLFYDGSSYHLGWILANIDGQQLLTGTSTGVVAHAYTAPASPWNNQFDFHVYLLHQTTSQTTAELQQQWRGRSAADAKQHIGSECTSIRAMLTGTAGPFTTTPDPRAPTTTTWTTASSEAVCAKLTLLTFIPNIILYMRNI